MTAEAAEALTSSSDETVADRLAALFDAHHRRLYGLARRLSASPDDARDAVQETFLRAARAPASVPIRAEAQEAWLVRVLVNVCRDRWRKAGTRQRLDAANAAPADESPSPEGAIIARAEIWRALMALPPRRRAVVVLHELEGATVQEIARLLGLAAVTVRWHLARGRRELARTIRGEQQGR